MSPSNVPGHQDSWITFLSRRSGANLLYRMHPDGSDLTPIFGGELGEVPGLREDQSSTGSLTGRDRVLTASSSSVGRLMCALPRRSTRHPCDS